jgi:phospholipid-binding lipoprotein MlaA
MRNRSSLILLLVALTGCASQATVQTHYWPPETPAADNAADLEKAMAMSSVSAADQGKDAKSAGQAPTVEAPRLTLADAPSIETYDPWGRFNRGVYRFNTRFDEAIFLPVANGYRRLPLPVRTGVHNFFANLREIPSVINYTLQGRLGRGANSLGRLVINSTVGIGGLFDVAKHLNMIRAPTGFGTTLAKWGMHPGAYLVIPILGPSTLREGVGYAADYGAAYGINVANLYRGAQSWGLGTLNAVDVRANTSFRYYSSGSPFEYETIRFLYVRKLLIEDAGLHKQVAPVAQTADDPAGK